MVLELNLQFMKAKWMKEEVLTSFTLREAYRRFAPIAQ